MGRTKIVPGISLVLKRYQEFAFICPVSLPLLMEDIPQPVHWPKEDKRYM